MSRWTWSVALAITMSAEAQGQTEVGRIVLELRPRAGDTLRLRLDQTTEMSGIRRGGASRVMSTTLRMYSRAIVESTTAAFATILALTDSVVVSGSDERARTLAAETERQLAGKQMRLRMAPDGTVSIAGPQANISREVTDLVSIMPASFPRGSVAVGETWLREMPIPPSASMGVPLGGLVKAAFKLDSITSDGNVAYLSMKGTMHPLSDAIASSDPRALVGSVNGSMIVDRRRGWLSESRFLIETRATLPPIGTAAPMQFRLRITQHMRVLEKRF
jgi:hypothetical protein